MALSDYRVLTPERVSLQYDIAGLGSRGAAVAIDTLIQSVLLTVLIVGLAGSSAIAHLFSDESDLVDAIVIAVVLLLVFAITSGYFILFEIIWSGQTPGKRVVGVRVLRENGYPIRPVDSTVRNLVRIVDYLPFFYAIGVTVMLFNGRSRRLGDFSAGTIVVREGGREVLATPNAIDLDRPHGPLLRAEDATLVRDFLLRRAGMHAESRRELATRLATALAIRYGLSVDADPEVFLERLDV